MTTPAPEREVPDADDAAELANQRAQRQQRWEMTCAYWRTTPREGLPPTWLAQPRETA